ncbi:MAG: hypothetical protein KJ906_02410 [Nanoarchaeota archaeon]|nr:hypothetical protein [Nanoarchaeota archaeon]
MNTKELYEILQDSTRVYRKGEIVEESELEHIKVVEIFGYEHTDNAPKEDNFDKIDMIFVDVLVDKTKAKDYKNNLINILKEYPQPERLAGGPSYIELAPNLEMEQESTLRLMALGKSLEMWDIISGKTLGMDDAKTKELAGSGMLMISGYKIDG